MDLSPTSRVSGRCRPFSHHDLGLAAHTAIARGADKVDVVETATAAQIFRRRPRLTSA